MVKKYKPQKIVIEEPEPEMVVYTPAPKKVEATPIPAPVVTISVDSHILDRRMWRGFPRREKMRILNENKE